VACEAIASGPAGVGGFTTRHRSRGVIRASRLALCPRAPRHMGCRQSFGGEPAYTRRCERRGHHAADWRPGQAETGLTASPYGVRNLAVGRLQARDYPLLWAWTVAVCRWCGVRGRTCPLGSTGCRGMAGGWRARRPKGWSWGHLPLRGRQNPPNSWHILGRSRSAISCIIADASLDYSLG
jgi:hypothetical protein